MYETPVKLARDHYAEIVHSFIDAAHASAIKSYNTLDDAEAYKRFSGALDNHLHYLETGDITQWREYCAYVVTMRVKQGLDYSDIIDINDLMLSCLFVFFTRMLLPLGSVDGEAAAKVLERLNNRLTGLRTVAKLTATAAAMQAKHVQPDRL